MGVLLSDSRATVEVECNVGGAGPASKALGISAFLQVRFAR